MTENIKDLFAQHTKEQIEALLDYFGHATRHYARKCDLVRVISEYLSSDPYVWLDKLMEPDLRLLSRLCLAGPDVTVSVQKGDYPTVVEVLQLVQTGFIGDEEVELKVSRPIYDLISDKIGNVIDMKESDGSFEVERLVVGCLNCYGVLPLRTFVDQIFAGTKDEDDANDLTGRVAKCPVVRLYQEEYKGEYYIASPFVDDFKEILQMRRMTFKGIHKYAKVNRAEAISAGMHSPECAYGLSSPEGQALIDMLADIGYSGDELQHALHTIWMSSQYALDEEATEILFSPVTSRQDDIPSFQQFKGCIEAIVNYSNTVPKWLLKGHSSNETNQMRLTVRVDELAEEYTGPADGASAAATDPLQEFYDFGITVPHTNPDDPCPCGSGFSYRVCHGKHFS